LEKKRAKITGENKENREKISKIQLTERKQYGIVIKRDEI
jgi:hypothetical protein